MQYNIQKISVISEKESAKVFLAGEAGGSKLFILKEIYGEDLTGLYLRLSKLSSPYLPEIYDISFQDNKTTLLEEYIEGKTLAEHLAQAKLSTKQLLTIMGQLCYALIPLHESEPPIIHRDIKPENIILSPDGNIKLIDLDAARVQKDETDHDTRLIGTRGYASPEQFGFAQTDARSDIYSMGVLLQKLSERCDCTPAFQKKLKKIIEKSTMLDPQKRYSCIKKMHKDLRRLQHTLPKLLFPCILLGILVLVLIGLSIHLAKTPGTVSNYTIVTAPKERSVTTMSQRSGSYRLSCDLDNIFVYLGHPVTVTSVLEDASPLHEQLPTLRFASSDTDILTVEDGQLIGWKEGTVTLLCLDENYKTLEQWTVSVTTFNDGKDVLAYRSSGCDIYLQDVTAGKVSAANLELAAKKVNTVCDLIDFFRAAGITDERDSLLPIGPTNWYCAPSASTILERRSSNYMDVINLAATLLQYDYEDSGVINICDSSYSLLNWYYEDGFYYCIDFFRLLNSTDIPDTDLIYRFETKEALTSYVQTHNEVFQTSIIVMVSIDNHTFLPPHKLSYAQTSPGETTNLRVLGYEESVFKTLELLYQGQANRFELTGIPTEAIPEDVPVYGKRTLN